MSESVETSSLDTLIGWNEGLSDTDVAWRAKAAGVADELRPGVTQWYTSGEPPVRAVARALGEAGLLGVTLPNDSEPAAASNPPGSALAYGLVCAELEGLDSGIRTLASVQGSLAMEAIHRFGGDEAHQAWLPGLRSGELVGCFALTEPDVGSDPAALRTTAEPVAGGYRLNGVKRWVSNGTDADVIVTWARTPDGISAFAVPSAAPGVSAQPIPDKASLRASGTAEVSFTDVPVDSAHHLSGAKGVRAALSCLNEARFGIIFGSVGAARDAVLNALAYTTQRSQFGAPLASFQLTQGKLAAAASEVARSWQLALRLARMKDAGTLTAAHVSLGKYANVRSALEVSRSMRTLCGANGTLLDHSPIRHAANLESVLTYEGTEEMHQLIMGQQLTGIPAFR